MSDDVLTRNGEGELAVRTVQTSGDNYVNPNDVYTRDNDGKLCVRVTGSGSGDQHNLGYYANQTALETAHPTAEAGDFALVGSTDTFWVWDEDTSAWVDTGNKETSTYLPFPSGWHTTSSYSTKDFCDSIALDETATVGKAYLGEVTLNDLPNSIVNSEVVVEIMDGTTSSNKVIVLTLTSGNVAPYRWQYTYWNGGTNVSGWINIGQQEQVDWNQNNSSAVDYIKNKPTIPSTAQQVGAVPQYTTMPTASASNVDEVAQYAGVDVPDVPASATITQTVGSGLTDLAVDVATFESGENPSGDTTVDFVANVVSGSYSIDSGYPATTCDIAINTATYLNFCEQHGYPTTYIVIQNNSNNADGYWNLGTDFNTFVLTNVTVADLEAVGVSITNIQSDANTNVLEVYSGGSTTWEKDGETVDLANYGITFTGTPSNNDTLEVDYSALVKGWTNGYFYKNEATYTGPVATISQTAGSGLTDLAVDVDLFVAEQQPSGDETVSFVYDPDISLGTKTSESFSITITDMDGLVSALQSAVAWNAPLDLAIKTMNFGTDENNSAQFWLNNTTWKFYARYVDIKGESKSLNVAVGDYISVTGTPQADDLQFLLDMLLWKKNNVKAIIEDYGVEYEGTPVVNDELTVVYTATTLSGYVWNQKNVQPASETPSAGIDWKTTIDLPADFNPTDWNIYPVFRIADGLPDGEYEMYFQAKKSDGGSTVFGLATYVLRFSIDNTYRQFYGWFAPVIDGNWGGTNDKIYSDGNYIYSAFWEDNGDFVIWNNGEIFMTNIHGYYANTAVPECFKLSAIKNVETGDKYIATGSLYNNDSFQNVFSGSLRCNPIQQAPSIPTFYQRDSIIVADYNALGVVGIGYQNSCFTGVSEVVISLSLGSDVFNATFKVLADNYELTVEDATGVFENTQVGRMPSYWDAIFVKLNFPAGTTGTLNASVGWKGASKDTGHYVNGSTVDNTFVPLNVLKVGVTPASANYIGKIMQYTGTTDANYTNGYFYKATGTVVTTPQSLTTTSVDPNDVSVTIDVDNLIPALQTYTGWTLDGIISNFNNNYLWQVQYDWDTGVIDSIYWAGYGVFTDSSILNCFTLSTTGSYSGGLAISFYATYTPETQTISGGAWTQVDVQPSGLQNTATGTNSLTILGNTNNKSNAINIGQGSSASNYGTAVGCSASAGWTRAVAIGYRAQVTAQGAIQMGSVGGNTTINSNANTFKVANDNGNFEIMDANGNLPAERLASITGLADGNYRPRLTISSGVATITWVAE